MKRLIADALLTGTKALPNGAATVYSNGFDLGAQSGRQNFSVDTELLIQAPALTTGQLADAATMKYSVQHAASADFSDATLLAGDVLVQTGAGGAGAAAAEVRVGLPGDVKRYVRVRAINSAAGNASTKSLTESLVF
jgi:hypothetical protein